MPPVLRCTFPFPDLTPPVQANAPCVECPNADRAILDRHAALARDDSALLTEIRSFIDWFLAPSEPKEFRDEIERYATDLYTRPDHSGTCVPKTVLFAIYKLNQFYGTPPDLSDNGRRAIRGEPAERWPDGVVASGPTWNQMFARYGNRYD
ncbi:MAG TPA: hypothetical protein VNL91_00660 [Thermoanaerobaculia bacterium]|nr:hypothetical protein [Thermoanaerobaculia bacterium]